MKTLITILLLAIGTAKAQTNSYRIAELEKWRTQAKAQLKRDSIAIEWLKKGKTVDSLKIAVLSDSLNKFKPIFFPDARVVNGPKVDTVYTKPQ